MREYKINGSDINIEFSSTKGTWCIPIVHGAKIRVRDKIYEELKINEDITNRFQLNIKRINRWWYSIYFKERKCEHCDYKDVINSGHRNFDCMHRGAKIEDREICGNFN